MSLNNRVILLGRNNEGKTNVLKAIQLIHNVIQFYSREKTFDLRKRHRLNYQAIRAITFDFSRDMEVSILRAKTTKRNTRVSVTYKLDDFEIEDLNNKLKSTSYTDGTVQVEVNFYKNEEIEIKVKIKEKGNKVYIPDNIRLVLEYITSRIYVNSIPSVRTNESAMSIVKDLIYQEIKELETDGEYKEALTKIIDLQNLKMEKIAKELKSKLKLYIPTITDMKISSLRPQRLRTSNGLYDITIDDGVETKLEDKGDGIISLVALSLLNISQDSYSNSIIMIDEPEAHLHSGAIKELKDTLNDLDSKSQIIISTHHQIFVDRNNIQSNFLVEKGNVRNVKHIQEVRSVLGVSLSENLLNSEYVLLVEGETDKSILTQYIKKSNSIVSKYLENNKLIIVSLKGTKNLRSQVMFYLSCLCKIVLLLDDDQASKSEVEMMKKESRTDSKNIFYSVLASKNESELEDMIVPSIHEKVVKNVLGIELSSRGTMSENKKFSDRISDIANSHGKKIDKEELNKIKLGISDECNLFDSTEFLTGEGKNIFDSLLSVIE